MLAEAPQVTVSLHRAGRMLELSVSGAAPASAVAVVEGQMAACRLALEAWAGVMSVRHHDGRGELTVLAWVPAPGSDGDSAFDDTPDSEAEDGPATAGDGNDAEDEPAASPALTALAVGADPDLATRLEQLQASMFGAIVVSLDLGTLRDEEDTPTLPARTASMIAGVVGDALRAFEMAQVRHCAIAVTPRKDSLDVTVATDVADAFDDALLSAHVDAFAAAGGGVEIAREGSSVTITARATLSPECDESSQTPDAA
jgi:hypothetical protein